MFFSRVLLAGLALVSFASAQETRVAFTSVPAVAVGGDTYTITWGGGDGSSVTITLRKGDPNDLGTIGILADNVEGESYEWTVSRSLEPADDYALQITQGQDQINYSGLFSIVEGDATNSTSTASASVSSTSSSSSNSTATSTIGLGSNSTTTQNSTTSTSSVPHTITTVPLTSANNPTSSSTATPVETSAPDSNNSAMQMTSSAAMIVGVIAAVMFLSQS